jgi:hypothetical protein
MEWAVVEAAVFGCAGACLFLFVEEYEPAGPMANLLKLLVLVVTGAVIVHKLQPLFGLTLF